MSWYLLPLLPREEKLIFHLVIYDFYQTHHIFTEKRIILKCCIETKLVEAA